MVVEPAAKQKSTGFRRIRDTSDLHLSLRGHGRADVWVGMAIASVYDFIGVRTLKFTYRTLA
jgi:hypothetical protein